MKREWPLAMQEVVGRTKWPAERYYHPLSATSTTGVEDCVTFVHTAGIYEIINCAFQLHSPDKEQLALALIPARRHLDTHGSHGAAKCQRLCPP